ncbi:unnamed protein product (macronuclear) [Paramecium tetraurelia]|uniref:Uncharacterized protein n=1 Tax=Paramecium tetraurelia TaxID=5888 RepID=A0D6M7_PARTE|nr:uncharacterized protein GSPATT00001735001 [Paramecium tetraurelia]CAK78694.1 unnamed protein product [Paramecium tetraurelia]|eukprot:XP_001446091.1 hypothetical protein (macronuclear) [Paramecium tetraurelia strain d4-2]
MRKSSSQSAVLSTMQNQRFYCGQKLKSPNKEFLKSNRSEVSVSEQQDSKSRANTLFEKIKAQNANIHRSENNLFLKVEGAILELYNQYEQNYQGLGSLGRIKTVQENLSVEFKKQNDQLIKTFDGLKLSDLDQNGVNQIQIDRYQFYYFRLRILEKPTPIHIHLQLPESLSFLLFKLMLSVKIEFPTKFNADQIIQSNYAKVYSSNPQAHYFKEEFLYLTFYSHIDFILKISVHFGQLNTEKTPSRQNNSRSPQFKMVLSENAKLIQTPDRRREKKGFSQIRSNIYQSSIEKETECSRVQTENSDKRKFIKIQPVQSKLSTLLTMIGKEFQGMTKEERLKKIEEHQNQKRKELHQDYLNKQKTFLQELEKRKLQIENHSKLKRQKIELVQQNKKNYQTERQQSIRTRLLLQEQISQFREIERSFSIRKAYAYKVSLSWGRIIKYILFIDTLYNVIKESKRKSQVQARGKLLVWTIKTKALISAKEYGFSTKERTITKSCIALKMIAINLRKKIKQKSHLILTRYLLQMRLAVTIVSQHDKTLKKIIQIQRNFRSLKQKKLTFRDKFIKLIKDNINQTIDELQRQQGKKTFYDINDKPVQQMDIICINQLIDEYSKQKKQIWYEYINNKFFEKDFHKKMKDFSINLKEPQLYELPKRKELIQIIEKYGKIKKLL